MFNKKGDKLEWHYISHPNTKLRRGISGVGLLDYFPEVYSRLNSQTRGNLYELREKYGIRWKHCVAFQVKQSLRIVPDTAIICSKCKSVIGMKRGKKRYRNAWSILFYGRAKGNSYILWRQETKNPQAGRTILYKDGVNLGKVSSLERILRGKNSSKIGNKV